MSFKIPLLIISFNRPELINKQLNILEELAPENLYVFSDGPRKNIISDIYKIDKCRFLFRNNIHWKCDTFFKFERKNKGCGLGVSDAITWFFNNVNEGIILEDDCFLSKSFFPFAEEMLEKYRNDLIVIKYGGNVFIDRKIFNNFISDISVLNKLGLSIIIVHGGGPRINKELEKFNIKPK